MLYNDKGTILYYVGSYENKNATPSICKQALFYIRDIVGYSINNLKCSPVAKISL